MTRGFKHSYLGKISFGYILCISLLSLVCFVTMYPFVYTFSLSISSRTAVLLNQVVLWPVGFDLFSYKAVLSDPRIMLGFYNSILYALVGTLLSVLLTLLTAYPLAQKSFRIRKILMKMIIFTLLFSGGMIPSYLLVRNLGLIDSILAIVLPGAIVPFYLIITKVYFEEIPGEIKDAAVIDGCNEIQTLFRIIIPLSTPIIACITLYYAVGLWNAYFGPLLYLNDSKKYPLQIFLQNIVIKTQMAEIQNSMTSRNPDSGQESLISASVKAATLAISIIPVLILYPFLQKYFVKGLMVGSIKG